MAEVKPDEIDRLREQLRRARELLQEIPVSKQSQWDKICDFIRETDPAEPKEVGRG